MAKKDQKFKVIDESLILKIVKEWILFYNTNRIRLN